MTPRWPKFKRRTPKEARERKKRLMGLKTFLRAQKRQSFPKLVKKMDEMFSDYLKKRSGGVCFLCGKIRVNAGVSHYFARRYKGTRWDVKNCDWVCWLPCHSQRLEHYKAPGDLYHQLMLKKLGNREFDKLEVKAHAVTKFSSSDLKLMIDNFSKFYPD